MPLFICEGASTMISRLAQHHGMHTIKMTLYFTFFHLLELQGADFKAWSKKDISNHMGRIIFMFNDCLRAEPEVWLLLHAPSSGEAVSNHKPLFTSPIFHKCTNLIDHNDCVGLRCCSKVSALLLLSSWLWKELWTLSKLMKIKLSSHYHEFKPQSQE